MVNEDCVIQHPHSAHVIKTGHGEIIAGDALEILPSLDSGRFQTIIADPPILSGVVRTGLG